MNEWIAHDDECPEMFRKVLVATDKGFVMCSSLTPKGYVCLDPDLIYLVKSGIKVTHWMPLPKPPIPAKSDVETETP